MNTTVKKCLKCGNTFTHSGSRIKRFCSQSCCKTYHNNQRNRKSEPTKNDPELYTHPLVNNSQIEVWTAVNNLLRKAVPVNCDHIQSDTNAVCEACRYKSTCTEFKVLDEYISTLGNEQINIDHDVQKHTLDIKFDFPTGTNEFYKLLIDMLNENINKIKGPVSEIIDNLKEVTKSINTDFLNADLLKSGLFDPDAPKNELKPVCDFCKLPIDEKLPEYHQTKGLMHRKCYYESAIQDKTEKDNPDYIVDLIDPTRNAICPLCHKPILTKSEWKFNTENYFHAKCIESEKEINKYFRDIIPVIKDTIKNNFGLDMDVKIVKKI